MPTTINPSGQTITQYNVQTGNSNNLLNNVAPSATSGVPLISQGAASQPIFGTAVVAGGGTGNTTFTAYSVITAGTTATGAFQNVSGVGTSGQVLTSNGAAALPTWQTASAPFNPNSVINLSEDFMGTMPIPSAGTTGLVGTYAWGGANTFAQLTATENGHPGVLGSVAQSVGACNLYLSVIGAGGATISPLVLGGGIIQLNWVIKIGTLSDGTNRYILRIGFGDTVSITNADQVNGVYFEYSDNINSGNWNYKTASASTRTTSNSSVAVTTGWHNLGITINAAASSVSFTVDGVSLGTAITTNIPTAALTILSRMEITVGSSVVNSILLDLMYFTQTLTSTR